MAATKAEISRWFDEGVAARATHMIVICDTFDWADYPKFVMPGENARTVCDANNGANMQRVMEVYALHLPKEAQLDERRSFHFETPPGAPPS